MKTLDVDERFPILSPPDPAVRASMYGFLSAAFLRPPEPELLQCMSESDLLNELSLLYGRSGAAQTEASLYGASSWNDPGALRQEYMDLFAVPTGRYVFPFEDVYRGTVTDGSGERKGPLIGPWAIAVKALYRQAGAQMDPACKELPTHIGVELSFMSFLCRSEAEAHCQEDQGPGIADRMHRLQLVFLAEHLSEWFPQLSRAIQANASSQFYRSLALLTEQVLSWDTSSLLEGSHMDVE